MKPQCLKSLILLLNVLLLIWVQEVSAQTKVLNLEDAPKESLDIDQLLEKYPGAVHGDLELGVFNTEETRELHVQSYYGMLREINNHMKTSGLSFGGEVRCMNMVFFNPDGSVDYFLFNFDQGSVDDDTQLRFKNLLQSFLENYTFPMKANTSFSQCGPVRYKF
jgi:hypothetical protein